MTDKSHSMYQIGGCKSNCSFCIAESFCLISQFIFYVYACVHMLSCRSQKRILDPQEVELQTRVNCLNMSAGN